MNRPLRVGMQVHAVPEEERAMDVSGRRMPFGYEFADTSTGARRLPMEKGPFGKSVLRRSASRSKTATPSTKEDLARQEDLKNIDLIFGPLAEQHKSSQTAAATLPHTHSRPAIDLSGSGPAAAAPTTTNAPHSSAPARTIQEPTEVMLYGFAAEYQYAAIDLYETASNGRIFEDYDRQPPHPRYTTSLSARRAHISRSLPREAIRKINAYKGGNHWIKVTFDSPEAAEAACHYSPHVINGYLVHCELFRGVGPNEDVPIPATAADERAAASGMTDNGRARRRGFNSVPARMQSTPFLADAPTGSPSSSITDMTASSGTAPASGSDALVTSSSNVRQQEQTPAATQRPLRIAGARRAVLRPASEALLPVAPWTTRVFGRWPIIGSLLGGDGADIIGGVVPRKENKEDGSLGGLDWEKASFWWKACWVIDEWLGTDLCGLKGGDE